MASPKTLYRRAAARIDEGRAVREVVTKLSDFREEVQTAKHMRNRLMMLMHEFLDAEIREDHDAMSLVGRGLSGYSKEELNNAYASAVKARKAELH